ncbi:MAG: DegV family protein, partial [Clostridiales bacterium]|nr:DegV family protein [Candidatus Apopatousia equi]
MKKFDISTDSNCDLYADEIKDLDIYVGHLCYTLDDGNDIVEYLDKYTKYEEYVDFYNKLRSGIVSKTSILSVQAHVEVFTEMAEKGIREVLHIAQSYGLSPTLDNANKAIEIVKEKYPDMHIVAIESSTTTVGEGLLVRLACDMR